MAAFTPIPLRAQYNAGIANVKTARGWLWPSMGADHQDTTLKRLPAGKCLFWGIPFELGEAGQAKSLVVAATGAGRGVPARVRIPVGRRARRLLLAHVCAPIRGQYASLEGTGEGLGSYRLIYSDGSEAELPLRRRFEIHDAAIPWGHHPFLCRHCREFLPVPLYDRSTSYGLVQTGVRSESSDLSGWWLYDWVNPSPTKPIAHLQLEASGPTPLALGALTLCDEESDPFVWQPREEVAVSAPGEGPVSVRMDRGVVVRQDQLVAPGADFVASEEAGWGRGGQEVRPGRYLEIHASPKGELHVKAGQGEEKSFNWGEVLEKGKVWQGRVGVELVSPHGRQWVHVRVEDADTRKPVGCRVHFRSSQGAYFAPHGHQADVNTAWFEDMGGDCKVRGVPYAYIDGTCQIELPVGQVFGEVVRGFEYLPLRQQLEIKPGQRHLTLKVKRAFDMKEHRYYSGDTHVHFLSSQSSHLEAAGEDLNVVHLLASQWGRLFTSWEEFTGGLAPTSSREHLIWVSQENRQHVLGHISLLGLRELVAPMCTGGPQEDWVGGEIQALMADWAEACRAQGGLVVMPHMPVPDFENAANIVLGQADAAEMCWIWQGQQLGQGELGYYRWLNVGQKLPIVGGTDKMSNGRILGGSRTYARLAEGEDFTFDNWCRAVKRGQTFASTGAMIDLEVEGEQMGEELALRGNGGTVEVEVAGWSAWPLTAVELIVNGRSVAREYGAPGARRVRLRHKLKVIRSSWVAARCWGPHLTDAGPVMAHSSPVYLEVGGRGAFSATEGNFLLTHLEGGIAWAEKIGVFRDEAVRARLIALFREAQEELRRRKA
ncbi:MAG: CehA/McbA family metallohydrolase [Candidatus Handelsmanbacteria bacterium]|nr:CehA/McbA family metallohydrolase [Candidatus Handelsmanbacteria bacterium]